MSAELFDSIRGSDLARVTALLDSDEALANAVNEQGMAAHTFAIYNRQQAIADLLETRGARIDIFAASMAGRSALITEMLEGNKALARLMSHDGWTPLHLAAFFGHKDAAEALLNAGAGITERSKNNMANMPLHAGAAGRNIELVKLLLAHGAPVNVRQHGGWTPLHAAAQNGDAAMTQLFLEHGADPAARADNQQLPIDLAMAKGNQEIVNLLEPHGA